MAAEQGRAEQPRDNHNPLINAFRTVDFWRRSSGIYLAYKGAQLRAVVARHILHKDEAEVKESVWAPQHQWAGAEMYKLCVDLRGFYLKVGARARG